MTKNNEELIELFDKLNTISSIGINSLVVSPTEDNQTRFKGTDDKRSIVIFYDYDKPLVDKTVAIPSLKMLLSRMNLFDDLSAVNYSLEATKDNADVAKKLNISSSEASSSCTFSDEKAISAPSNKPKLEELNHFYFDKDSFNHFMNAVRSIRLSKSYDEKVLFKNDGESIKYHLNDGIADYFTKTLAKGDENKFNVTWRTDSVEKIIKKELDYNDDVKVTVTDKEVGLIDVNNLMFMIAPE